MFLSKKKGFTLIELLVVVAIIGILSSVVLASLNSARTKARDVKRFADLRQLQNALELYRTDNFTYPTSSLHAISIPDCRAPGSTDWTDASSLGKLVTEGYISSLPVDPVNSASNGLCYTYEYFESGLNTAWTCIDGSTTINPDGNPSGTRYTYMITFKSETNDFPLPLLNGAAKTYCLLGPTL